jgi:hypothetical protein
VNIEMSDRDAFADRRRAQEEDYFRKKDAELIQKLRRRSEAEAALRQMAEHTGVADEELLRDLQERGFSAELIRTLPLVPFIQIAWADGTVSKVERDLILEQARTRGFAIDSEGYRQIEDWLTRAPDDHVFETATRLINAMLAALPPDQRDISQRDLLSFSTSIATASGGILGFGSITAAEGALLERLSAELERAHAPAVEQLLKGREAGD